MISEFKRGFIIYKDNEEPLIMCPHSGPSLINSNGRDDNSDTIGSLLRNEYKGKLVLGNMPRRRLYGVDFNRDIPELKVALESYAKFLDNEDTLFKLDYMRKYAFVAFDENDYYHRLRIYQNFWSECENAQTVLLIHRAYNRIKGMPSVIDFITFKGKGLEKVMIKNILNYVNRAYYDFFKEVNKMYKQMVMLETERMVVNTLRKYNKFNLNEMSLDLRNSYLSDMKVIKKYSNDFMFKRMNKDFAPVSYLDAARSAIENSPLPRITLEEVFDGSLALGPKRKLFPMQEKLIVEIEVCEFLATWYPEMTVRIIKEVVEMLK
ncbi:hypothetical protein J4405_02545 [Candidatus Woesearchaeota archaeon]|nr:hypothetical protein [Candidatus Woesearchaeota archaeon]